MLTFPSANNRFTPGDNFDYHLIPFEAAFAADTSQIMPYYGMPVGTDLEEVGFGFNKQVITDLLRNKYGIVCTDWRLLSDAMAGDQVIVEAKCWGVEHLTIAERAQKALEAGVDQFGGETCPEVIVELGREEVKLLTMKEKRVKLLSSDRTDAITQIEETSRA